MPPIWRQFRVLFCIEGLDQTYNEFILDHSPQSLTGSVIVLPCLELPVGITPDCVIRRSLSLLSIATWRASAK
jgi:hypothetical protein